MKLIGSNIFQENVCRSGYAQPANNLAKKDP